eukprot:CAMPEP_0169121288 /NCGR_PEP_ID=MMETSP1015-20121227/32586_1 /TAXON_ID=342587 /ORGANISM="Karlodinium micrum, Strain CCMP2283" /LENGTH=182 /DNA_ID=CAMNT_0009184377 /DNA_START=33 /DNA_END=581 /DNA_ORIENTATION=+
MAFFLRVGSSSSVLTAAAQTSRRGISTHVSGIRRQGACWPATWSSTLLGGIRCASREPVSCSDIRKGMIILHDGRYVEVETWQPSKTGRSAQSYKVAFVDLETGKPGDTKYGGTGKVTRIEPDKFVLMVSYVDSDESKVVLADEDYNEVELPLAKFDKAPAEGAKVVMWKDDDALVKLQVMK